MISSGAFAQRVNHTDQLKLTGSTWRHKRTMKLSHARADTQRFQKYRNRRISSFSQDRPPAIRAASHRQCLRTTADFVMADFCAATPHTTRFVIPRCGAEKVLSSPRRRRLRHSRGFIRFEAIGPIGADAWRIQRHLRRLAMHQLQQIRFPGGDPAFSAAVRSSGRHRAPNPTTICNTLFIPIVAYCAAITFSAAYSRSGCRLHQRRNCCLMV